VVLYCFDLHPIQLAKYHPSSQYIQIHPSNQTE
jgi:hypothetical protein